MTRQLLFRLIFCLAFLLPGGAVLMPENAAAQPVVRLSDRSITIRGERYLIHKVRKGETLYAIAKAYAVSQEDIMRANSLTRDVLRNKQTLLIPQDVRRRPAAAGTTASGGHAAGREDRPEPQLEPITPSVPPRPAQDYSTYSRHARLSQQTREQQQIVSTHTDTLAGFGGGEGSPFFGDGRLKEIDRGGILHVAVLLPMQPGLKTNDRFSEYYKGILLGLNALKTEGVSAEVRFLNTGASEETVRGHIRSGALERADLIIGPVYAEAFDPAAEYAAEHGIPIVSPLGTVGAEGNPYVYEAPPVEEYAYRPIFDLFGGRQGGIGNAETNLILIDHVEHPDTAALALIEAQLGDRVSTLLFTGERTQSQAMDIRLNAMLDRNLHNIIFVPVNRADALEGVLSHLSSINMKGQYRITVIGTPRWAWLQNFDLDLFYKLNVHYPASYHADRSDPSVAEFYREYMDAFGSLPSPYAFRGYDVIRYFGGALNHFGSDMPERISNRGYEPKLLQVGYDFRQENGSGKYRNMAWPVVNFKPDYTIRVIR
ncbi:LysM peptidoglycan-binding domain-containing protein [uncultured Rikenella sp.]|uniref:PBP1 and LysM peptidoglycan-binding domain-containing protein n=1 Tax=uncultured Rikenella sp. TaxID=368003 RepID=UPI0026287988|nr:LysM peptidoglycan-binding domain-containing protein [uncultured Rikenella sp.]